MQTPILMYFADPMCSWCWGFTPVVERLRETFAARLRIALYMGGLRPGQREPLSADSRAEIFHHWHSVHELSGQPFRFEGALPEGFVYDTEAASRAVIAVAALAPTRTFDYFRAVQAAFYTEAQDVTEASTLRRLAADLGVGAQAFDQSFSAEDTRLRTRAHFERARQLGIRGFPSLVLNRAHEYVLAAAGYCTTEQLLPALDAQLEAWRTQNDGGAALV